MARLNYMTSRIRAMLCKWGTASVEEQTKKGADQWWWTGLHCEMVRIKIFLIDLPIIIENRTLRCRILDTPPPDSTSSSTSRHSCEPCLSLCTYKKGPRCRSATDSGMQCSSTILWTRLRYMKSITAIGGMEKYRNRSRSRSTWRRASNGILKR